ncbi:MAG: hypothetical protein FJ335_03835 [Sphingomonadales bacterium]|nr:hypothetical protein [Sphingomonadales bacterium]
MTALRRLFRLHPGIAVAIVALALAMKLLVPAGFMPTIADGRIVVSICTGAGPTTAMMEMPGMAHHAPDAPAKSDPTAGAPCAFAGLASPSLAAVDPLLLAVAILVAMALASRPIIPPPAPVRPHVRPPLRGPPRPA